MSTLPESGAAAAPPSSPATATALAPPAPRSLVQRGVDAVQQMLNTRGGETVRYLMTTDAHTYAFAVAANAVLSFFPFLVMMLTITRRLDHYIWKHFHLQRLPGMNAVVIDVLRDYLPVSKEWVANQFVQLTRARSGVQVISVVMLLITSTGVFLPLEVALNRIWGFPKNRSYLLNQLVSLGLAVGAGVLALLSVALTAGNQYLLQTMTFGWQGKPVQWAAYTIMKVFAVLATIAIFFLVYWLLPHGKVRARDVAPAAVVVGMLWEICKYLYILCLPLLDFREVYGPFSISVTLIFWAFISGLLLLAGAHLSAGGVNNS